jgi:hypothetical protein
MKSYYVCKNIGLDDPSNVEYRYRVVSIDARIYEFLIDIHCSQTWTWIAQYSLPLDMDCTVQSAIGFENYRYFDYLIGVCGGFSHTVQLSRTLGIWELKGYDTGTWSVDSCLDTMVSKNSMGDELASRRHAKLPNWQDINF